MKLYVAYCQDRHIDPVIRVFDTEKAAIAYADNFIAQMRPKAKPEGPSFNAPPEWVYYRSYSCEGDHVRVEVTTLNDA